MLLNFIFNLFVWLTIGYIALLIWARNNPSGLMELKKAVRKKQEELEEKIAEAERKKNG